MQKKLIEIDFNSFVKILYNGIWIIISFSMFGLLIGYIYEKNFQEQGVQYRLHIQIHELAPIEQILVNDFSNSLLKLYKLDYEKLVITVEPFIEVSKDDDFAIILDRMIKRNVANILDTAGDHGNLENNNLTSKDLINLVFQTTQRDNFMSLLTHTYNENLKDLIKDKSKIESFTLKQLPDYGGGISQNQGSALYTIEILFLQEMEDENIRIFSQNLINQINIAMNKQLMHRFELAKDNYYSELNNMQKNINFIINTIENEYKIALISKINSLEFQRNLAKELDIKEPIDEAEIFSEKDYYKRGYLYLNRELVILNKRLKSELSESSAEIRFYNHALNTIKQKTTLKRVERKLTELGLFNNAFKTFDVSFRKDMPLVPIYTYQKIQPASLYAIPFSGLFGLFIGIIFAINNFFVKNRKNKNAE